MRPEPDQNPHRFRNTSPSSGLSAASSCWRLLPWAGAGHFRPRASSLSDCVSDCMSDCVSDCSFLGGRVSTGALCKRQRLPKQCFSDITGGLEYSGVVPVKTAHSAGHTCLPTHLSHQINIRRFLPQKCWVLEKNRRKTQTMETVSTAHLDRETILWQGMIYYFYVVLTYKSILLKLHHTVHCGLL